MIVPGDILDTPHFTTGVVENNGGPLYDGDVLVAWSVLKPTLKVLPVHVMNLSEGLLKLYKGKDIATCEPVTEVDVGHSESSDVHYQSEGEHQLQPHVEKMVDECSDDLTYDELVKAKCILSKFEDGFEGRKMISQ